MKIIASIYLAIGLIDFVFWLFNGQGGDLFSTPHYLLTYSLYFLGLLSLSGFILGKLLLPQRVWQCAFVVYFTTRVYELIMTGLPLPGESLGGDVNIIFSYLWLVLPAGLAMWYLGFVHSNVRSRVFGGRGQGVSVPCDSLVR